MSMQRAPLVETQNGNEALHTRKTNRRCSGQLWHGTTLPVRHLMRGCRKCSTSRSSRCTEKSLGQTSSATGFQFSARDGWTSTRETSMNTTTEADMWRWSSTRRKIMVYMRQHPSRSSQTSDLRCRHPHKRHVQGGGGEGDCGERCRTRVFRGKGGEKDCHELPDEDKLEGQDMVGIFEKSLYGSLDAALNFQKEVRKIDAVARLRCGKVQLQYLFRQGYKHPSHGARR